MIRRHRKAYRVLQQVAREQGVTVETVIREINVSIYDAYTRAHASGDTEALKRWEQIPCSGELPDALEFLEYMGGRLRQTKRKGGS